MRNDPRGIDKLIQDAQQEGKFDDLACKGQPLHVAFGDLASVANDVMRDNGVVPEWITLAREIEALRERQRELIEGFDRRRKHDRAELEEALPAWGHGTEALQHGWRRRFQRWWLGERAPSQRAPAPAVVDRMERDRKRVRFQFAGLVRQERKKVERYNLILAVGGRQMHRVRVEARLQDFQERFPALTLHRKDGLASIEERPDDLDPALLIDSDEGASPRSNRNPEQAQALHALRRSARRPPPIG